MDELTEEELQRLRQAIYEAFPNAIFSQEFVDGPTPSDLLNGLQQNPYGQEVHLVNPSPMPEKDKE